MNKLKVITSTNREGRKGTSVANWVVDFVRDNYDFDVELLDLAEINLPFMNEPNHPSLGKYQYEHTKKWSATIQEADAFIIVLAEYNYGYPAPIKNAIDYLSAEWKLKPVGFVSYGGISAGLRSTQMLKQVVTSLNMMPISEQVSLPFFGQKIDENGVFHSDEHIVSSAHKMMNQMVKLTDGLKVIRNQ